MSFCYHGLTIGDSHLPDLVKIIEVIRLVWRCKCGKEYVKRGNAVRHTEKFNKYARGWRKHYHCVAEYSS